MNLRELDLIVVDLDDTMFLERDYAKSGFNAVGSLVRDEFGESGFSDHAWDLFMSGARGNIFNEALRALEIPFDPNLVVRLVEVYRSHTPEIHLASDASRAIRLLSDKMIGVVSDGPLNSQAAKAHALDAPKWASHIILTESLGVGFSKPHPLAFETLQERSMASPGGIVYIADNPMKDFVSPRALGWKTVRISRPLGLHRDVPSGDDVDFEVESFDELF